MRRRFFLPGFLMVALAMAPVSGCDYWPEELRPLAESISRQVSGETIAWRVGRDVVVINVANSPLYHDQPEALETIATGLATQAIEYCEVTLESVAITFHEQGVSDDPGTMREYIFLVRDGRPGLLTDVDLQ